MPDELTRVLLVEDDPAQDALAPPAVPFPVWTVVRPVVKPLHDSRATGDVILDLARRVGGDAKQWSRWSSVEEIIRERGLVLAGARRGSAFVEAFRQDELRELEARGWWLPHGQSADEYWGMILQTGGWFDPVYDYDDRAGVSQHADGRAWFFPLEARRRLERSPERLAEGFLPIPAEGSSAEAEPQAFPLRLVPFRVMTLASGGTALMPWLLEHVGVMTGHAWETWAELSPETARELGLRTFAHCSGLDGLKIVVEAGIGSIAHHRLGPPRHADGEHQFGGWPPGRRCPGAVGTIRG